MELFGAATLLRELNGMPRLKPDAEVWDRAIQQARAGLTEQQADAAFGDCQALTTEEIVRRALESQQP
jgi:hypothetical protein